MLLELFPFVILNNVMAFLYAYFFSNFLHFDMDMSILLLTVTLRGVSNKHSLLSLFSFLAHLSRRLTGELIVYRGIRRPPSVRRPSVVRQHFQTTSPLKP